MNCPAGQSRLFPCGPTPGPGNPPSPGADKDRRCAILSKLCPPATPHGTHSEYCCHLPAQTGHGRRPSRAGSAGSSSPSSLVHVLALAALMPFSYTFAWWGIPLVLVGNFIFGSLGINLGYHRMLTHTAATFPKLLERLWVLFGVCSLEGSPLWWVCTHRMHHQHSRRGGRPAQPAGELLLGPHGVDLHGRPAAELARHLREVRPGPDGRPVPALAAPRREVAARVGAARAAHRRARLRPRAS